MFIRSPYKSQPANKRESSKESSFKETSPVIADRIFIQEVPLHTATNIIFEYAERESLSSKPLSKPRL